MKANDLLFGKMLGYMAYGSEFNDAVASNSDLPGIGDQGSFSKYANWRTPILRLKRDVLEPGVYAGDGDWHINVTDFYESVAGAGQMQQYSDYMIGLGKEKAEEVASLIELRDFDFVPAQNAQNSKGEPTGKYTIIGK